MIGVWHERASWRVLILPYLEQKDLDDEFDRNESWDSPHNLKLLARRPSVYDSVRISADPTLTYSQVFVGKGAAFEGRQGVTLADFPDGPDRTLLVVEANGGKIILPKCEIATVGWLIKIEDPVGNVVCVKQPADRHPAS